MRRNCSRLDGQSNNSSNTGGIKVSTNTIIGTISPENEKACHKIVDLMKVPPINLVIYLDDFDSDHYSLVKSKGLYRNVRQLGWKTFEEHELTRISEFQVVDHLIWISSDVVLGECIDFAWTLCHELQHLHLSLLDHRIPVISNFIDEAWAKNPALNERHLPLPDEFNCDYIAHQVVSKIFEKAAVKEYIQSWNKDFITEAKRLGSIFSGNVRNDLIQILQSDWQLYLALKPIISAENEGFNFDLEGFVRNEIVSKTSSLDEGDYLV